MLEDKISAILCNYTFQQLHLLRGSSLKETGLPCVCIKAMELSSKYHQGCFKLGHLQNSIEIIFISIHHVFSNFAFLVFVLILFAFCIVFCALHASLEKGRFINTDILSYYCLVVGSHYSWKKGSFFFGGGDPRIMPVSS